MPAEANVAPLSVEVALYQLSFTQAILEDNLVA